MLHILEKTGRKLTITLRIAKDLRVNSGKSVEKVPGSRKASSTLRALATPTAEVRDPRRYGQLALLFLEKMESPGN